MALRKIFLIIFLSALLALQACLGNGSAPDNNDDFDDSVIGRFMREIGTEEMDVLLRSPYHSEDPGLPVEDLLFMLENIPVDTLITLVKKTGARKVLDLMYSIKRLGCNRPVDGYPLGKFNIPDENNYMDCTRDDYDHLNIMVELVKGTENVEQLVAIVNGESIGPTPPESGKYLEKLAYVTVYLNDIEKMLALINGTVDPRDTVYFIDRFDRDVSPPVSTKGIVDETEFRGLTRVLKILKGIEDKYKLYTLINGKRKEKGPQYDSAQREYISGRMVPLLEGDYDRDGIITGGDNGSDVWILKLITLINASDDLAGMIDLVTLLDTTPPVPGDDVTKIINIISSCYSPAAPAPDNSSIQTLAYITDNISDRNKMLDILHGIPAGATVQLINTVSSGSRENDRGGSDIFAAGKKLCAVIDATSSSYMISLVNAVIAHGTATTVDMASFMNSLKIRDMEKTANIINVFGGTQDALMADLLAPYIPDASGGVGYEYMAQFISALEGEHNVDGTGRSASGRAAAFIMAMGTAVNYMGGVIVIREGMVRLIRAGVEYQSVTFPGLGPKHTASMMNGASEYNSLALLMNNTDLDQMVPIVGCGDRVGDPEGDGIGPFLPNFHSPCSSLYMGW